MITFRSQQIEVFRQSATEDFKDRATVYLFENYPEQCLDLGFDSVRGVVDYGLQVSDSYGITRQFLVLLYLELMFEYGVDFDQDDELPWAQAALNNPALSEDEVIQALAEHLPPRDEDVGPLDFDEGDFDEDQADEAQDRA